MPYTTGLMVNDWTFIPKKNSDSSLTFRIYDTDGVKRAEFDVKADSINAGMQYIEDDILTIVGQNDELPFPECDIVAEEITGWISRYER